MPLGIRIQGILLHLRDNPEAMAEHQAPEMRFMGKNQLWTMKMMFLGNPRHGLKESWQENEITDSPESCLLDTTWFNDECHVWFRLPLENSGEWNWQLIPINHHVATAPSEERDEIESGREREERKWGGRWGERGGHKVESTRERAVIFNAMQSRVENDEVSSGLSVTDQTHPRGLRKRSRRWNGTIASGRLGPIARGEQPPPHELAVSPVTPLLLPSSPLLLPKSLRLVILLLLHFISLKKKKYFQVVGKKIIMWILSSFLLVFPFCLRSIIGFSNSFLKIFRGGPMVFHRNSLRCFCRWAFLVSIELSGINSTGEQSDIKQSFFLDHWFFQVRFSWNISKDTWRFSEGKATIPAIPAPKNPQESLKNCN